MPSLAAFKAVPSAWNVGIGVAPHRRAVPVFIEELVVLRRLYPEVEFIHFFGNFLLGVLEDLDQGSCVVTVSIREEGVGNSILASAT